MKHTMVPVVSKVRVPWDKAALQRRSVKLSAHVRYSQSKLAGVGAVRCHD